LVGWIVNTLWTSRLMSRRNPADKVKVMNRHVVAVALVVLAFFAVRFVTADEDYVSETMGWMASQTGVELPDWYADHPWLAVGLEGDGLVFVTQTVDPFGFEGHSDRLLRPGYRFTRIGYP